MHGENLKLTGNSSYNCRCPSHVSNKRLSKYKPKIRHLGLFSWFSLLHTAA